ncbi:MAG: hypothetical protein MI753_10880 [Hyphomicrobiales bacterium]|nr:hypothetical protein [Hyphomicrobiales bacterium]
MNVKRLLQLAACIASASVLAGCYGVAAQGGAYAMRQAQKSEFEEAARAGDASAQLAYGRSYCCAGLGYSTQKATEWICRAARQDYTPAQIEIGKIYLGNVVRSPSIGTAIIGNARAKRDRVVALAWLKRAQALGNTDANRVISFAETRATPEEIASAEQISRSRASIPCTYTEVFKTGA